MSKSEIGPGGRGGTAGRAETVVRAALALVDSGGLESLTMRRLATSLDMQLPTIYRLFDGKRELLDEMAETLLADVLDRVDLDGADWAEHIALLARGMREVLLAQRDGARIVGGNYAGKEPTLTLAERTLEAMREAGFPLETAIWAGTTVACYVVGEVLEQQGYRDGDAERLSASAVPGAYPNLAALPVDRFLDFDGRFEFGLRMIVTGLRGELAGGA
ncbi:TetR/AcrR family transcriptional regulator C-terminal domain-containing protein [Actinomadura sediminis]|uniref:TetR/AcrR family transcriptional regulator C-terminal domain-containing protein n=1 Tax=Actinomadura sediminis TaxID=1038904 RepID=A0ABW3EZV8_9ACTN